MSLITAFMMELAEESAKETEAKGKKVENRCNNSIATYEEIMESLAIEDLEAEIPSQPTNP